MIATVNSVALKLPPSVRDFQVYRFVKFECNSTREAAGEFCISQTRVRQVIARVIEFLLESAPPAGDDAGTDDGLAAARMVVAEQLAREQLEYLYQRAMKAFDDTQREDVHGNLLPGKVCYLAIASRITLWMAKVPVQPLPEFREDDEDAAVEAARLERRVGAAVNQGGAGGQHPPVADCSVGEVSRGAIPAIQSQTNVGSDFSETSCKSLEEIKAEAWRGFLRPAQATVSQNLKSPASGDDDSPGADPPPSRPPLNRQERRARERMRQRILAKR